MQMALRRRFIKAHPLDFIVIRREVVEEMIENAINIFILKLLIALFYGTININKGKKSSGFIEKKL